MHAATIAGSTAWRTVATCAAPRSWNLSAAAATSSTSAVANAGIAAYAKWSATYEKRNGHTSMKPSAGKSAAHAHSSSSSGARVERHTDTVHASSASMRTSGIHAAGDAASIARRGYTKTCSTGTAKCEA